MSRSLSTDGPADYADACVRAYVSGRAAPPAPEHTLFAAPAACFVTLKRQGELRGCIGTLEPAEPDLGQEIARNAYSSAFQDPRFPPLTEAELVGLSCSVDVLGPSEACTIEQLDPARYGVIVRAGLRRGVLLPDLAGVDTVRQQVGIALQKAGIRSDERFDVSRFAVVRFRQGDPPRDVAADVSASDPEDDG